MLKYDSPQPLPQILRLKFTRLLREVPTDLSVSGIKTFVCTFGALILRMCAICCTGLKLEFMRKIISCSLRKLIILKRCWY